LGGKYFSNDKEVKETIEKEMEREFSETGIQKLTLRQQVEHRSKRRLHRKITIYPWYNLSKFYENIRTFGHLKNVTLRSARPSYIISPHNAETKRASYKCIQRLLLYVSRYRIVAVTIYSNHIVYLLLMVIIYIYTYTLS